MGIFHFFWVQGADAAMWIRAAFAEFLLQRCHGDSENFRYLLVELCQRDLEFTWVFFISFGCEGLMRRCGYNELMCRRWLATRVDVGILERLCTEIPDFFRLSFGWNFVIETLNLQAYFHFLWRELVFG